MGLAAWIELIGLVLKFPSAVLELARLFQKTPEEKRIELSEQVSAWIKESASSERPIEDKG